MATTASSSNLPQSYFSPPSVQRTQIRHYALPIIQKLSLHPDGSPSRSVFEDLVAKLDSGYYEELRDFARDCRSAISRVNNKTPKGSSSSLAADLSLSQLFEFEIDQALREMGYCCGLDTKLSFSSRSSLSCSAADDSFCEIPLNAEYYVFGPRNDEFRVCAECFARSSANDKVLVLDPKRNEKLEVPTMFFTKTTLTQSHLDGLAEMEPLCSCSMCGRTSHVICALDEGEIDHFRCARCRISDGVDNSNCARKFSANRLSSCNLSRYLEAKVNFFLSENGSNPIAIRVVSSMDKELKISQHIRTFLGVDFDSIKYRGKTIFAFQNVDGHDVLFFAMLVQQYNDEAPECNRRRVYVAYLDSVKLFQPASLRTRLYHSIVSAYLEYASSQGYTCAHLWSCPPRKGDDYIFNCHPPWQKLPSQKQLHEWYEEMFKEKFEYLDFVEWVTKSDLRLCDVPIFSGDFWLQGLVNLEKDPGKDPVQKLQKWLKTYKGKAFTVLLRSDNPDRGLIPDPDPLTGPTDIADERDEFLTSCRRLNLEFSNMRRAKYSSLVVLKSLFKKGLGRKDVLEKLAEHALTCNSSFCPQGFCSAIRDRIEHVRVCNVIGCPDSKACATGRVLLSLLAQNCPVHQAGSLSTGSCLIPRCVELRSLLHGGKKPRVKPSLSPECSTSSRSSVSAAAAPSGSTAAVTDFGGTSTSSTSILLTPPTPSEVTNGRRKRQLTAEHPAESRGPMIRRTAHASSVMSSGPQSTVEPLQNQQFVNSTSLVSCFAPRPYVQPPQLSQVASHSRLSESDQRNCIVAVIHAARCPPLNYCARPDCAIVKPILQHAQQCGAVHCSVENCERVKSAIRHWQCCPMQSQCPVCGILRKTA